MNAWLVRPKPEFNNRMGDFLENNLVAIGWSNTGDLSGKSRDEIKGILSSPPFSYNSLELGNAYATVDLFVNQMKPGDLLLVPDGNDIHFAQVESGYEYNPEGGPLPDIPHQRKVRWLEHTERNRMSKKLRSSLKVHRTVADLSRHTQEIESLSEGREYQPARTAIDVSYPLRPEWTVTFQIPSDMTDDEAERLAAHLRTLHFGK